MKMEKNIREKSMRCAKAAKIINTAYGLGQQLGANVVYAHTYNHRIYYHFSLINPCVVYTGIHSSTEQNERKTKKKNINSPNVKHFIYRILVLCCALVF